MSDATGDTYWDYTCDGVHYTAQTTPQGTVYFAFDSDGRRIIRQLVGTGSWNYTYDNGVRLAKLTSPTDGTTTLAYDGVGGRGTKDANGQTQYGLLSVKTKGSGDYETYAADQQISIGYWFVGGTQQNALVYSYDPTGNVHTVNQGYYSTPYGYDGADQLGYIDFSGFGGVIATTGSTSPFSFGGANGCLTDPDASLILMGHRYFDPRTGRFISRDPIKDGNNWYAYCDNNPVNLTDPLGLVCAPFDSTGMGFFQIYDYVTSHGGLPGEEYETYTNGKLVAGSQFIVSGFSFAGQSFVAPYGSNIDHDISQARNFYKSNDSKDWRGGNGRKIFMHDPKKVGDWLINNYGPGTAGDPKKYGKQYDAYGHAIYAAAAAELQVTLPTIIDGEVGVHNIMHPFSPGEQENGEIAGWGYAQVKDNPGSMWTDSDFVPSGFGFLWQKVTGN